MPVSKENRMRHVRLQMFAIMTMACTLVVFSGVMIYMDKNELGFFASQQGITEMVSDYWEGKWPGPRAKDDGSEIIADKTESAAKEAENDAPKEVDKEAVEPQKTIKKQGFSDPVDLDATYPIIEANGAIDFYPEHFMTVIGTWGFGSYSYLDDVATNYMNGMNDLANRLSGKATVYNMPIPLSSSIKIPDAHWQALNSMPQGEAIGRLLSKGNKKVMQVQVYNSLMEHRKEYVFFRTDHHWTAKGAYYAYRHFCERKGLSPNPLKAYKKESAPGYSGYYAAMTKDADLLANPDTVVVYHPLSNAVIVTVQKAKDGGGIWKDDLVVQSMPDYAGAFIHGDNAFSIIENIDKTDGESCVVVKDSFGNAFIPFLVDHYKTIYVADFRYCEKTIPQIVDEYGVKDVIFAINITNLRNASVVGEIVQMMR